MRTQLPLLAVAALFATAAVATEATVDASASRKPIAPAIYSSGLGDEAQQAQLAASYAIGLPSGELAKVALLGTFGQQNVAGSFEAAQPSTDGAAIDLYTDYDGQGARFGDTSIQTASTNPLLSVFASFDLDGKVTVVLLNKSAVAADAVALGFKGIGQKGDWRAFELTASGQIVPAGTGTLYDAVLTRTVQPYSAVLVEYRPVGGILPIRTAEPIEAPAVQVLEVEGAAQPMGCSAASFGVLSLGLLGLLGVFRKRRVGTAL